MANLWDALKQYIEDASPGGALNPEVTPQGVLDAAAISTMPVPVLGDVLGAGADIYRMAKNPEERTLGNAGLAALGLIPFVPGTTLWHGSNKKFNAFDSGAYDSRNVGGTWLTDSPRYADELVRRKGNGDNYLYKVDANIKNPMVFDILEEGKKIADDIGAEHPANPLEAQELLSGGMGWDSVVGDLLHEAKLSGHDSLILKNFNDSMHSDPWEVTNAYVIPSGNEGLLKMLEINGKPMSFWGF